eukprot:4079250-Amphidinium_carterae.2
MERNASLSWKAHPFPLAERTISSTKACNKSTAKPHPAGMPEVATTGSETAPLTKILLRPRYMSNASRTASKGKPAASADCSSNARSTLS